MTSGPNSSQRLAATLDAQPQAANTSGNRNSKFNKFIAVLGAGALALAGLFTVKTIDDRGNAPVADIADEGAPEFATAYAAAGCGPKFAPNAVEAVLWAQGFEKGDYTIITKDSTEIDVNEAGQGAFNDDPVNSLNEHFTWMNSGTEASKLFVKNIAKDSGDTKKEVKTEEDRWVMVQFENQTVLPGNTVYENGKVVAVGARNNSEGDAVLVYVGEDACKTAVAATDPTSDASIKKMAEDMGLGRAGCSNLQDTFPIPYVPPATPESRPGTPVTPEKPCVKPPKPGDGTYIYNPETCTWHKPDQSFDDMQNGDTGVRQAPQDNNTSGVDVGPTRDGNGNVIPEPAKRPVGPAPAVNSPAVAPVEGGYDAGASDGSGTPAGSTGDTSGTTTGNNDTSTPEDSGQGGTATENDVDTGGF